MKTAPISEIFKSIQGEGMSLGSPCVFVRFFGCNLRCQFQGKHCDTPYAVLKKDDNCNNYSIEEVYDIINKLGEQRIVFTGGEPMLYEEFILDFIQYANKMKKGFYIYEMETNGTIPIRTDLNWYMDQFNVSIKLKSSNQEKGYGGKRINYNALHTYPSAKTNYKFVISNITTDDKEINEIMSHSLSPKRIYLMPEGMTRKEIIKNSPKVIDMCIKEGYWFSPREHIMVWDKKRGV
jgi:organic radical activating enzyme